MQKKLDSSFLSTFTRSNIDYVDHNDPALLAAYRSGIYDATVNSIGESNLKVTGTSQTIDEVKKFLRQASFNGELILKDNKDDSIKTMPDQELLAENWFKNNNPSEYTQLILMIPKDNDRNKLSKIVHDFFQLTFSHSNYAYVEHTDTDIFHYHVIVEKNLNNDDLLFKWRSDFIGLCIQHAAQLL